MIFFDTDDMGNIRVQCVGILKGAVIVSSAPRAQPLIKQRNGLTITSRFDEFFILDFIVIINTIVFFLLQLLLTLFFWFSHPVSIGTQYW